MDKRVTPPRQVTSPTCGPPPPCKQALKIENRLMGLSEFKLRTKKTSSAPDSYTFKDMPKKDNKNKKKNRSAWYVTKGGNGGWEIENRKSSLKRKNDFFFLDLLFIMRNIYFSAVIINIQILYQKRFGSKLKKRNKLMTRKEVTLTSFVKSLSEV